MTQENAFKRLRRAIQRAIDSSPHADDLDGHLLHLTKQDELDLQFDATASAVGSSLASAMNTLGIREALAKFGGVRVAWDSENRMLSYRGKKVGEIIADS